MIQRLPIEPSVADQIFETTLDGQTYVLRARWNYRMGTWFLDILDEDQEPIALGLAIVLGAYIGRRVKDERMPPGLIAASDLSGQGIDATLDDITTRVAVYYYSQDEFA